MSNRTMIKVMGILTALLIVGSIALTLQKRRQTPAAPPVVEAKDPTPSRRPGWASRPARRSPAMSVLSGEEPASETPETPEAPPEFDAARLKEYLDRNQHNAASLITAFQVSKDTNYLKQAAANFPDDPRVQLRVITAGVFPEEKREWLDRLKKTAPTNSLADYLSAREHFQSGDRAAALAELLDASGKSGYEDYTREAIGNLEELHRVAGDSALEAKTASLQAIELPQLATLKGLAVDVKEMEMQYVNAGDADTARRVAQLGVTLARRLNNPDDPGFMIKQLVGIAMESVVLQPLDPNATYEFLGGKTGQQRLDELKQQRADFRGLTRALGKLEASANDPAVLSEYHERMQRFGEAAALRWLDTREPGR